MSSMIRNNKAYNEQREAIIAMAVETPDGRSALAGAMVDPIKNALNYQGVIRKLVMVDELPQGAYPRYERDITVKSWIIGNRAGVPSSVIEGEDLFIPTVELAALPTIRLQEVKSRRYYIVDRAQVKAKDSLQRQEDTLGFQVINAAVPTEQSLTVIGQLQPENLNLALTLIEEHELVGAKIVLPPSRYKDIRGFGKEFFDEATQRDILMTGLYGHIYSADIHVSTMVPKNCVYLMAPAQFVGAMPIRQDVTVIPADDPRKLRLGWVVYEDIGIGVINDYSLARIQVSAS
jgi:hypothetical protein